MYIFNICTYIILQSNVHLKKWLNPFCSNDTKSFAWLPGSLILSLLSTPAPRPSILHVRLIPCHEDTIYKLPPMIEQC